MRRVFLGGGPLFLGSWIEGGSVFDEWEHLTWSTNLSLGVLADTMIGSVFGGFSFGFEGGTRFYIAIGQLFRSPRYTFARSGALHDGGFKRATLFRARGCPVFQHPFRRSQCGLHSLLGLTAHFAS